MIATPTRGKCLQRLQQFGPVTPYLPFHSFLEDCRELRRVISGEESATRLVNSILWQEVKSVAGPEYARPTTGVSITPGNSGNGALPTREPAQGEDQDNAGQ